MIEKVLNTRGYNINKGKDKYNPKASRIVGTSMKSINPGQILVKKKRHRLMPNDAYVYMLRLDRAN